MKEHSNRSINMEIGVYQDTLEKIGGSEKVAMVLADELDADLVTTNFDSRVLEKTSCDININVISLGQCREGSLKPLSCSYKFWRSNLDYDLYVFSGSWCHYASKNRKPSIWYTHCPPRAFYSLYEETTSSLRFPKSTVAKLYINIHKLADKKSISNIDKILCNSKYTSKRIKNIYNRDSEVVYPPVDLSKYSSESYGDYWLSVNRIHPTKRIHLQLEVFKELDKKLIIVGSFQEGTHSYEKEKLLEMKPKNVDFLGDVKENELLRLYSNSRGLLSTAKNEDFGMNIIEAFASEKPVVATAEGGHLETMIDNKTGKLVKPEKEEIINAIKEIDSNPQKYKLYCSERAEKFSSKKFLKKIRRKIEEVY